MITTSASPSAISAAPQDEAGAGATSFAARVGAPIPRGLRVEADAMTWDAFLSEYAPHSGPLRLGHWACTDDDRPATRIGPQARNFQATLAVGDRIDTSTAAACGPVAALTEMLHGHGVSVELTAFHQVPADGEVATFIRGSDGLRSEWALGLSDDATQSALRAVIACANRLLAA